MLLIIIIVIILVSFFISWNREDLDGSSLEPFMNENIYRKNTILPSQVGSLIICCQRLFDNCFPN